MNAATPLVRAITHLVRDFVGAGDLQISQVAPGGPVSQQTWHGSAKVGIQPAPGILPSDAVSPFFIDFRVNHPHRLSHATPREFHELVSQLERMGYQVLAFNIVLEDGVQLEIINEQSGRTV
ncbi:hypothetical protein D3C71_79720 [compost metagenome]